MLAAGEGQGQTTRLLLLADRGLTSGTRGVTQWALEWVLRCARREEAFARHFHVERVRGEGLEEGGFASRVVAARARPSPADRPPWAEGRDHVFRIGHERSGVRFASERLEDARSQVADARVLESLRGRDLVDLDERFGGMIATVEQLGGSDVFLQTPNVGPRGPRAEGGGEGFLGLLGGVRPPLRIPVLEIAAG